MKKLTPSFVILLCLFVSIAHGQTFTQIDLLDWSNQSGDSGFTTAGTNWNSQGNVNKDCDGQGVFGPSPSGFLYSDWEGTCGCDCIPNDPSPTCGQNDSSLDILLNPNALSSYCQVRVSFDIAGSAGLTCGTNDDLSKDDYSPGQCNDDLGDWEGTDFMSVTFLVFHADGTSTTVEERICGSQGLGTFEETFDEAVSVQILFVGGTQSDATYEVGNITIEGVAKDVSGLKIFPINHDAGFICANSSLPLILQTNATPDLGFVWTGPNNFTSTSAKVQFDNLDTNQSGVYTVQVTDNNGCISTAQTSIEVRDAGDASCTSTPEFSSLFPILCSNFTLPSQSDNGVSGTWQPSADLSAYAGQTLDFTFVPNDASYSNYVINIEVDDLDRLDDFAIQPTPIPVFCNESDTRFDLIQMFQMNLDLALTVNGEEDIFYFISNNEYIHQVESEMRNVSFQFITPGEKNFFIEAISPCGETNQLSFKFIVLGATDPIVIDTALCRGDYFEYLGIPITQDTIMEAGECGGGIEINLSYKEPRERRAPIGGSFCAVDRIYVYDTIGVDGRYVGLSDTYFPEYADAIDTIFSSTFSGRYVLPFPASNGCDSIVNLRYTWPDGGVNLIEFDLCENEEFIINAGQRDWVISAASPDLDLQITCDSAVIVRANILPVEIDSVVSTFCADQDTLIEDASGNMILFNKDYSSDVFYWDAGPNGCSASKVVELTFLEPEYGQVNELICNGDAIVVGDQVFTSTTNNVEVTLSRQNALGCDSIVVVNVEMIDATIQTEMLTCDNSSIQLSLTHNGTLVSWSGPNGFTSTSETPSVTEPGNYTVTIAGPNGCTSDFQATVTQDVVAPQLEGFGGVINCNTNGQIALSAASSDGTITGWTGPNGFSTSDEAPVVTEPGDYTVTAIGSNGCETTRVVTVTKDDTPPTATALGGELNCNNSQQVRLSLTTNDILVGWTGPNNYTSTDLQPTVTEEGEYIALIQAANGCEITVSAIVNENIIEPTVTVTNEILNCTNNMQINLVADTDDTILSWEGPDGFSTADESPVINTPGTYTVTVQASNGCMSTADLIVTEDSGLPTVEVTNQLINCDITEATLAATTDGTIIGWAGPDNYSSLEVSPIVQIAGDYIVTVRGANGCENVATLTVDVDNTLPTVSTEAATIGCNESEAQLVATTTDNIIMWTGPNGYSSTDVSPMVADAGDYTVTVQGANGCIADAVLSVTVDNAIPTVTVENDVINCTNDGTVNLNAISDATIVSWVGPDGFTSNELSPAVTVAGDYTITASYDNGCPVTEIITITEDIAVPTVSVTDQLINCDVTDATLSATTNGTIVSWTGPDNYSSTDVSPIVQIGGDYIVTVRGANGCEDVATLRVDVDNTPPTVTTENVFIGCNETDAQLVATTTDNIVIWTGPNGFSSTDVSPTVTEAGDYMVTVQSANGCITDEVVTVALDNATPALSVDNATINCNSNGSVALIATSDATTVSWTGPNGYTSSDLNPEVSVAGDYEITAMYANGCPVVATVTVSEDMSVPDVSGGQYNIDCNDSSVALQVTTTATITGWTGPNNFTSVDAAPVVAEAGDYIVTVEGDNGCTNTAVLTVTLDDTVPDVTVDNLQLNCSANSVSLLANTSATIIGWTGPNGFSSNQSNPTATEAGDYIVTVQGANGCTAEATLSVTEDNSVPTLTTEDGVLNCLNDMKINLVAQTDGQIVGWTGPGGFTSTDVSPEITFPGEYIATASFGNGCEVTSTLTVTEDIIAPSVSSPGGELSCANDGILSLSFTSAGTFLNWEGPEGFTTTETSPAVQVPGVYTVYVQGANGCINSTTAEVSSGSDVPSATADVTDILTCDVSNVRISMTSTASFVSWEGPDGSIINEEQPLVSVPGTYTVTVENSSGCQGFASIEVVEDVAEPSIELQGADLDCINSASQLVAITTGDILGWRGPNGFNSAEDSPMVTVAGTYEVEVVGANGCTGIQTIEINENIVLPEVSLNVSGASSCSDAGATINAITDGTITGWTGPNGFQDNSSSPTVFESGDYEVTVRGTNGCTTTEMISVNFTEMDIEIGQIIGSCEGVANGMFSIESVTGAAPPFTLRGLGADIEITSFPYTVDNINAGTYNFTIVDANGCDQSSSVDITNDRGASLTIDALTISPLGEYDLMLDFIGGDIDQILWEDIPGLSCYDCINPSVTIEENTTFTVTVFDEEGCSATTQITLSVEGIGQIYLPNIVNSNSTSGNNKFYPQGISSEVSYYDMKIFDRWGNDVYEINGAYVNDATHSWTGMFNGRVASSGVYVYCVTVYNDAGAKKVLKGDVTFIR